MVSITSTEPSLGFWQRRFTPTPTKSQLLYDFIIGALLPLFCFILDPIVFHSTGILLNGGKTPFFASFRNFAYSFSMLEIAALCYWLILQSRPNKAESLSRASLAFFSGIFFAGTLACILIGLVLLPISLFGLMVYGLGALGFSPLLVAWVYWRNAIRASKQVDSRFPEDAPARFYVVSFLLVVAIPTLIHFSLIKLS